MKTITLMLALIIAGCTIAFAQCGKKITITTLKTDHLDSSGNLTRSNDETAVVVIGKNDLTINVGDDHKMTGVIKSNTCDWPTAGKDGKTLIKTVISDSNGGPDKNVTITITGIAGKVTLLFEVEGEPDDRVRVVADKFELADL